MKVKIKFPLPGRTEGQPAMAAQNAKAIREDLLLDTSGSGVEKALFNAATMAAGLDQKVFVSRGYTKAGRLSVWIVDDNDGSVRDRSRRLKEALARVKV